MRRFIALLLAAFCQSSFAAGPWDGIYETASWQYFSIHQNGNKIILAQMSIFPTIGSTVDVGDGQRFLPPRADVWDLFSGDINGSTATVSGEMAFGACVGNFTVIFFSGGAEVTRNFFTNTAAGTAQGVNCASLFQVHRSYGPWFRAVKVF